jgi:ABC-type protease/lipase transport system fused ATPase/permease subunit
MIHPSNVYTKSQSSPMPAEGLSRRTLVKGLGAYPIVAGTLTAGTAAVGAAVLTDPIFAAIETHKQAAKASATTWQRIEEIELEAHEAGLPNGVLCPDHRNEHLLA